MYIELLKKYNLLEAAKLETPPGKAIHGGKTKVLTEEHFTHRYANSASRISYIISDPFGDVTYYSREITTLLSSGRIGVLDLVCGAGAAVTSMANTIRDLRVNSIVPSLPLDIVVVGADYSAHALDIYTHSIEMMGDDLARCGITIGAKMFEWDATCSNKTSQLCDAYFKNNANVDSHIVIVSNISGDGKGKIEEFKRSFQHVVERFSDKESVLLWVEHSGNSAEGFVKKVLSGIFLLASWFVSLVKGDERVSKKFQWFHKIINKELPGGYTLLAFKCSDRG
jgi:hypothetical protein